MGLRGKKGGRGGRLGGEGPRQNYGDDLEICIVFLCGYGRRVRAGEVKKGREGDVKRGGQSCGHEKPVYITNIVWREVLKVEELDCQRGERLNNRKLRHNPIPIFFISQKIIHFHPHITPRATLSSESCRSFACDTRTVKSSPPRADRRRPGVLA